MRRPAGARLVLGLVALCRGGLWCALGLGWAVLACAQPLPPVRIGLIGPFSGPSAAFGLPMHNGVRLAVDEVNAAGGYLGRPLELVVKDDRARPAIGREQAEALVAEQVLAVIGFCNAGVAQASLEVFQKARVPLLIPCASETGLTAQHKSADSYIFRTAASDALQTRFLVAQLLRRGWRRVAVFADTTAYGEAGVRDVAAALAEQGLSPAHVARFPVGVRDLEADLRAARSAGASVIVSHTVGPENAVIARGRHALKWNVPLAGTWTLSFPFFLDNAQEAADGTLVVQTFIAEPGNGRQAGFLQAYARTYGVRDIAVPVAAAQGHDTLYLLMHALFALRSNAPDGPALKGALEHLDRTYHGVVGTYENPFAAADKEAIKPHMLQLGQVQQGRIRRAPSPAERPERSARSLPP